jgi:hypothetical protein
MREDERGESSVSGRKVTEPVKSRKGSLAGPNVAGLASGGVMETTVSPFHCLYNDALDFHTQSRLRQAHSEAEASRLARAALLFYLESAEALVHQAAVELGRPELAHVVADPSRPLPLLEAWRLLPVVIADAPASLPPFDPSSPPWPQFAELLTLRDSWAYPGPASERRAYYFRPSNNPEIFEPLDPHHIPTELHHSISVDRLVFPRTGLPRDPYALRPHHLDTARAVLDAAIEALDRRVGGALTHDRRHRNEPVRVISRPPGEHAT